MDKRRALTAGTVLGFPGLECQIESQVGRGSNSIVYRGWYADSHQSGERHEVLIKELFPLHPSGAIYRGEDGRIICGPEGAETYGLHRSSFETGNAVHLALLRERPDEVGANLNTYALNDTLYTVLGFNGGRSLGEDMTGPAAALRPLAERVLKLLDALEGFHASGLLHLDIAPDNIMLLGKGRSERVMLIDYNSCRPVDAIAGDAVAVTSVKPGYTAPEVRSGRFREIGPCSDLYSVAAVFYRGISGEALTPFQMIRPVPPDVSDCPCIRDLPDTVRSWVQQILRRGLCALPARRYRGVEEMRADLRELLDRIDGVGITHWALWEAGWRNVERAVRDNPSLAFLRDPEALYPACVEEGGEARPIAPELEALLSPDGASALLVAGGGMGKTTTLLRAAFSQSRRYAPSRPAVAYVSLYGWREGENSFILDRVLETLRFKSETRGFEDARKALSELLDQPLPEGNGPALLLLLDGLNEAAGDTQALVDEIARLSCMRGVRILAATRTDETALPFRRLALAPLRESDVQAALSGAGLLSPQSPDVRAMLRTPLMLSIFIQSSRAEERQLNVHSREELMRAYFAALKRKELDARPENAEARWQIEAAMDFVLPTVARELHRRQRALSDAELLPAVEWCYRLFASRLLRKAFPQWIGRSGAIRGGTENAEAWYGIVVHDILWKRLGLLLRDGQGRYQVAHQIIGEYLLDADRENRRRITRRRRMRAGLVSLAAAFAVVACALGYLRFIRPQPYDAALAEALFDQTLEAYVTSGLQCEDLNQLIACATESPGEYAAQLLAFEQRNGAPAPSADAALAQVDQVLATGGVMPWSGRPMDRESCASLLALPGERGAYYVQLAGRLAGLVNGDAAGSEACEAYIRLVAELIDRDAEIAAGLYRLACEPHLTGRYAQSGERGGVSMATLIPTQEGRRQAVADASRDALRDDLERLLREREALLDELQALESAGLD